MTYDLQQCVIRILNSKDQTVGAGFVVSNRLAVSCAHVIQAAGSDCNRQVSIQFFANEQKQMALVLNTGWSPASANDIAFLQLEYLPEGIEPAILGPTQRCRGHSYNAFGFAKLAGYESRWSNGILEGTVPGNQKQPMLQLQGNEIKGGMSGAPVLDIQTERIVGMVSEFKDDDRSRIAWATTSDTLLHFALPLVADHPMLRHWPEEYGPKELEMYLQHLITANETLYLPDGRPVLLERIYVSLRADEMNAIERQAEHNLYLDKVASITKLKKLANGARADQYAEFDAIHKTIARQPIMFLLRTRDWQRLFGKRERHLLSLAEVEKRHRYVVVLGDPGSGKTTLGKWLVLQFARALLEHKIFVHVRADLVQPGAGADKHIDLGPVRLPIFIRIADYARARWEKEQGDSGLSLEQFISFDRKHKNLPIKLTSTAVDAMTRDYLIQGRALVVLDGLDEVSDPNQRRAIMQTVKSFIQAQPSELPKNNEWGGNRLLLTSRIVGYQFDPLTNLPHYTVEDMDEMAISAFCQAWMTHVAEVDEAEVQGRRLKNAIFEHSHRGVRALAGNPLLLTILAQVYWTSTSRSLPTRRVSLFDSTLEAFYKQRSDFWSRVGITPMLLTHALGAVAAYIHADAETGFAEEGMVREKLREVLSDWEKVETVLEAAREVSGFLVERGEGVYGFLHRAVQEYFVAKYLTYNRERMYTQLAERLLDPTWREPIVLAVGVVSQPRYPGSRDHLRQVFDTILNTDDPAGDFLPRRELLAVAACLECEHERVPEQVGQRVAERLLALYARRERNQRSPVLRKRIHDAFNILRENETRLQAETALCDALSDSNFELRYAAIDIIIETKWDSRQVAQSLVKTWSEFADPAVSLLTALDEMLKRSPDCFQADFLPLRQTITANPRLWEKASINQQWKALFRALYLPLGAYFKADRINRDSPLTPYLLKMLQKPLDPSVFIEIQQHLLPLASQQGTALARDAALALSALGDASWLIKCIENADSQKSQINSIAGCLVLAGALEQDLERSLPFSSELDVALELSLASARNFNRQCDELALHRQSLQDVKTDMQRVKPLAFKGISNISARVDEIIDDPTLANTRTRDLAVTLKRDLELLDRHMHTYVAYSMNEHFFPLEMQLTREMCQVLENMCAWVDVVSLNEKAFYTRFISNNFYAPPEIIRVNRVIGWREFYKRNSRVNALAFALGVSLPLDIKWASALAVAFQPRRLNDQEIRQTQELMKLLENADELEPAISGKLILFILSWGPSLFVGAETLIGTVRDLQSMLESAKHKGKVTDDIASNIRLAPDITIPSQRHSATNFLHILQSLSHRLPPYLYAYRASPNLTFPDRKIEILLTQALHSAHTLGIMQPIRLFINLDQARDFVYQLRKNPGQSLSTTFQISNELVSVLNHISLLMEDRRSELYSAYLSKDSILDEQASQRAGTYITELSTNSDHARALANALGFVLPLDTQKALEYARRHKNKLSAIRTGGLQTRDSGIEMARVLARVQDLFNDLEIASLQERLAEEPTSISRLKRDFVHIQKFIQLYSRSREQNDRISQLSAVAEERSSDLKQVLRSAEKYASNLAQELERALRSDTELSSEIDLASARHLDFAFDFDVVYNLARPHANVSEIVQAISEGQNKAGDDDQITLHTEHALVSARNVQKVFATSTPIAQVVDKFIEAYMSRWSREMASSVVEPRTLKLNSDGISNLVPNLFSSDDLRREGAKETLVAKHLASELGQAAIEQIAEFVYQHANNPQIATQLMWTLEAIIHDQPAWIEEWISQVTDSVRSKKARIIIESIHHIVPKTYDILENAIPHAEPEVNKSLLSSFNWLVRLKQVPRGKLPILRKKLFAWLKSEEDLTIRGRIIETLGYWSEDSDSVGLTLLAWIDTPIKKSDLSILYKAAACQAIRRANIVEKVRRKLRATCSDRDAAAALIRLSVTKSKGEPNREGQKDLESILNALSKVSSDTSRYLEALLGAGIDDDIWDDEYHGVLVNALRTHLELQINASPDQKPLTDLLERFEQSLQSRDWPTRRFLLAVVAACTEVMPVAVQHAYKGDLEVLFTKATTDAESFNSRRFALTALGYLRTITPTVVPALMAGCHDTEEVQRDTVTAASHFQSIDGDLLPVFIEEMNGESVSRAYMVTHLLSALGSSTASETFGLRDQIITAVVKALKDNISQQEVLISGERKGKLEDALYTTLLRVAGWMEIGETEKGVNDGDIR